LSPSFAPLADGLSSRSFAPSKGKKRHAIVDTLGLIGVAITPADVQDRDGFIPLLKAVRRVFVFLQRNAQAKSNFAGRRHQRCR
jgi:hypothetical protein